MIKKCQIKQGIRNGTIESVKRDRYGCFGTVCKIGSYVFYFGGETAKQESPAEYLLNSNMKDTIDCVWDALNELRRGDDDSKYEYTYYESILKEMEAAERK